MVVVSRARHADRDRDGDEAARCRNTGAFEEDPWRIGVVGVPPPEERRREIDRHSRHDLEPGLAKLRLKTEAPSGPLRRPPGGGKHDQHNDGDLTPEYLRRGHSGFPSGLARQSKRATTNFNIRQSPIVFMRVVA